jgi:uncharacterized protein YdeI (YjbR/CyaY-like superfamily)
VPTEQPELTVADAAAWRRWLRKHHADSDGVWLVLAKKGTTTPTTLTYDQALDEALCHGWIDGQRNRLDEHTFIQRYTPRRRASPWSARNVDKVAQLIADGRMHPAGQAEIDRAKEDGRWDKAYPGMAAATIPDDLAAALAADATANEMFGRLNSTNRFAILWRIEQAKKAETRARRVAQFVEMLSRGETPHPQKFD